MGLGVLYKNIILLLAGQEYIRSASSLKILSLALVFATLACFYINVIILSETNNNQNEFSFNNSKLEEIKEDDLILEGESNG